MGKLVTGLSLVVVGALVAWSGLIRLGFGRHAAPWYDLSFFGNALTAAHVENLATLAVGVGLVVIGGWLVIRAWRARRLAP